MKKHIRLFSSIALFLVLSAPVLSLAQQVKKQRLINKSYPVTADDKLEIDNQFGNVAVSTWDRNEITVDIEIGARAATEERAQEIMDKLDVKDSKDGHTISFKTNVDEINSGGKNKRNEGERSFYIDYVIHMPTGNRLEIENSFGKTEIGDFKGLVSLTSKFGSLNTGKLDNVDLIDVEFGKAFITEVNNGRVIFKYNDQSRIGKVNGDVKITSEFSGNVQFNVADNIKELNLFESYSTVRMVVEKSLSADFDVHTSFGSFRNESSFNINEDKESDENDYGPKFDKDYSGRAGEGRAKIKIKSSFGTVRLSYSGQGRDQGEKHKNKDKDIDEEKEETKTTRQPNDHSTNHNLTADPIELITT
ncbi:MAG TPA: hypothetical protein VL727_01375 [Puia sp.]|nr:hypothetical protein [Puia sp.]